VKLAALRTVPIGAAVLVTVIGPVVAPLGTVALSCVEETNVTVAAGLPLNLAVEVLLNPRPLMVTTVPAGPPLGVKLVMLSVGVKLLVLVPVLAAVVTAIFPGTAPLGTVALSWVGDTKVTAGAAMVPNLTVAPGTRFAPVIVTVAPVIPEVGVNEPTVGGP